MALKDLLRKGALRVLELGDDITQGVFTEGTDFGSSIRDGDKRLRDGGAQAQAKFDQDKFFEDERARLKRKIRSREMAGLMGQKIQSQNSLLDVLGKPTQRATSQSLRRVGV